jgi:hypothetical protein
MPRLIVFVLLAMFLFFGFYIFLAILSQSSPKQTRRSLPSLSSPPPSPSKFIQTESFAQIAKEIEPETIQLAQEVPDLDWKHTLKEEYVQPNKVLDVPSVAGQTVQDLKSPEPLQATPPSVVYDIPEAIDPMNKHVFMNAEFGSNLRHPEQMIESHPKRSMGISVRSGVASDRTINSQFPTTKYTFEMIQNGGVMSEGLVAYDPSNSGVGSGLSYSLL